MKFAGPLLSDHTCWKDAFHDWIAGNVLCEEAKQHIHNYLMVTQTRLEEGGLDEEGHSDDMLSDEDLKVGDHELEEVLQTHFGARDEDEVAGQVKMFGSKEAVERSRQAWCSQNGTQETRDASNHTWDTKNVAKTVKAANAMKRCDLRSITLNNSKRRSKCKDGK